MTNVTKSCNDGTFDSQFFLCLQSSACGLGQVRALRHGWRTHLLRLLQRGEKRLLSSYLMGSQKICQETFFSKMLATLFLFS